LTLAVICPPVFVLYGVRNTDTFIYRCVYIYFSGLTWRKIDWLTESNSCVNKKRTIFCTQIQRLFWEIAGISAKRQISWRCRNFAAIFGDGRLCLKFSKVSYFLTDTNYVICPPVFILFFGVRSIDTFIYRFVYIYYFIYLKIKAYRLIDWSICRLLDRSEKYNKKLIRRWDNERELSLRRLVHKFHHRSTRLCVGTHVFTKFSEITQYNGHYVVQGHLRSPILVPIESSYTTSY